MHDLVIRNGHVIDGTGSPIVETDIAIDGDKVTQVGGDVGNGRREIDAKGLLVTPGFVDIHTHYDGQATWDPYLTPSTWHGVTTAVFGNCGVGFAPVRPGAAPYLINLMEGVEDIPGTVLAEGVKFDWESFPQYLDRLDAAPKAIDIGAQVPHAALRFFVMGDRGADHAITPTDDEIRQMGALLEESLKAGALGFTTSRTIKHRARDGRMTPSLSAREPELFGLAKAMRRAGRGVLEVNSDFVPGEFEILRAAAEVSGRPLSVLLLQVHNAPDRWKQTLADIHAARAAGLDVSGQVGTRPIGIIMGLETTTNPFSTHPAWLEMEQLSPEQRYERLVREPDLRRRLIEERPTDPHTESMKLALSRTYLLDQDYDYEPSLENSIEAQAIRSNRNPWAVALETMMSNNGKALLSYTFENYFESNLDIVRQLMTDDATVIGLGDGGAHVCTICDSSAPTFLLTHWARDRKRGPKLPIEYLIKKHTQDTARTYGLNDRGVIKPGFRADINIIDFDALRVLPHEVVYDLPAGGKRLIQRGRGYKHTFVAGTEILVNDEHTGALPGKLLR